VEQPFEILSELFVFVRESVYKLCKLHDGNDGESESHSDKVFFPADGCHAEHGGDVLHEDNDRGKEKREDACAPEPKVLSLDREY